MVKGEHRRPIDGCSVASGRWRQRAEPESEEMAYVYTLDGNGESGNGQKGCEGWNEYWNGEYWKRLLECNTAELKCRTGRMEWKTARLDGNYLFNGVREMQNVTLQK